MFVYSFKNSLIRFIVSQLTSVKKNTSFIKNIGTLLSGNVFAQVLSFAIAPVITRLYTPADYGVLALFIALCGIFNQWSSLTYNQAIILAVGDEEAVHTMALSILCLLGVCGLTLTAAFFLSIFSQKIKWIQNLGAFGFLMPLAIFICGMSNILQSWNIRKKQFKTLATAHVASVATTGGTRICAGLIAGSSVAWLIIGFLGGFFVSSLIQFKDFSKEKVLQLFTVKRAELGRLAKQYRNFPIFNMPANMINSIFQSLPVFMLGFLFSPIIVGYYALTKRILSMPVQLFSISTRQVFLQKLSELHQHQKPLAGPFLKTTFGLLILSIVPALFVFFAGECFFSLLLGKDWATSGRYAAILVPWLVSQMVMQPSNTVYIVLLKQRILFWLQLINLLSQLVVFMAAHYYRLPPETTLQFFMIVVTVINCGIILRAYLFVSEAS